MSKLTLNDTIQEFFEDPRFDNAMLLVLTEMKDKIQQVKNPQKGVKQFLQKFTISEIKLQYLLLKNRKAYLTDIQKKLIVSIVKDSIVETIRQCELQDSELPEEQEKPTADA